MIISGPLSIFLVGCAGGVFGELLKWYQLRESLHLPSYTHSLFYWTITVAMVVAGGALAVFYGIEPKSAFLVANIGLSAPLVIKQLAELNPAPATRDSSRPSLSNFLAGRPGKVRDGF